MVHSSWTNAVQGITDQIYLVCSFELKSTI
ncbi:MAG: hypothetical protein JWR54_2921 [Mucilaginibacter sp.]|nr:hypothetical protein [Mucilaginibacter sp.]